MGITNKPRKLHASTLAKRAQIDALLPQLFGSSGRFYVKDLCEVLGGDKDVVLMYLEELEIAGQLAVHVVHEKTRRARVVFAPGFEPAAARPAMSAATLEECIGRFRGVKSPMEHFVVYLSRPGNLTAQSEVMA